MPTITPFLWFDNQAEEAANFYVSVFDNSAILNVQRTPPGGPGQSGAALTVEFELEGQKFIALNGGPQYRFTEATSFFTSVSTQEEVDELWERLSAGGEEGQCGWLKDRYGLSWQVIPTALMDLMSDPDPEKAGRVTQAMLKMSKIDIQQLKDAYYGKA